MGEAYFWIARSYIKKQKPDLTEYQAASYTLPVQSYEKVNTIVDCAIKAGASEPIPKIDEGFMQVRTIEDFDGYTWAFMYLDMKKFRNR